MIPEMSCQTARMSGITARHEYVGSPAVVGRQSRVVPLAVWDRYPRTACARTRTSIGVRPVDSAAGTEEPRATRLGSCSSERQPHLLSRELDSPAVPGDSQPGAQDQRVGGRAAGRSWQSRHPGGLRVRLYCQRGRDLRQRHRLDGDWHGVTPPTLDAASWCLRQAGPGTESTHFDSRRVCTPAEIPRSFCLDGAQRAAALCDRGRA